MITFTYDGFNFSDLVTVHEVEGRGTLSSEADAIKVRGREGVYLRNKLRRERLIDVKMSIQSDSPESLRILTDYFNEKMDLDYAAPLVFSDEPRMEYMALVIGDVSWQEIRGFSMLTISFTCPDPYKYGPPTTTVFNSGVVSVRNDGTVPAAPVVDIQVLEDITYVDVFNNEGYMRIGQPVPVGAVQFSPKTQVLHEDFAAMDEWSSAGTAVDGGAVSGTFGTNGYAASASSFGTPTTGLWWHGPAIKRTIAGGSVDDFEVEWHVQFNTEDAKKRGRIELYLMDDQSKVIAKMAMKRIGGSSRGNMVELRVGDHVTNYFMMNFTADDGTAWNDFNGIIRIARRDNMWEGYVAKVANGKHTARAHRFYKDGERIHMANLSQVQLHAGKGVGSDSSNMYSHDLKVHRFNEQPGAIPVIATTDDTITFDFVKSLVSINGEPRPDLKDFGARFFKLSKGVSTLLIEPSDSVTATLTLREAFK